MITWQGVTATAIFSVVNSGVLAAYALVLGANNFQIGILASLPFIMQPFQIPAIILVERLRLRKVISLLTWFPAQVIWLVLGLIPLFIDIPSGLAVGSLMGLMAIRGFLTANMSTAWNSWVRDIVPRESMGRFFSRRLAYSTIASIIFGLGGALFIDIWQGKVSSENDVFGYSFVLIFGSIFLGMSSVGNMLRIPEPQMQRPEGPQPSIIKNLSAPLKDKNFAHLMRFLMFWGFASNLAIPFFVVYMLTRLGLPLTMVIGLTVLSQLFNVLFLRVWGPMADKFSYKAVLSASASLYLLVIIGWAFTTMPERYLLTIPLLIILHIFAGIAAAGVNLGVETIGLKLAPEGQATSYLVGASLATSIGAALGPLVGGFFADFLSVRELAFNINWTDPFRVVELPALILTGYDFLFAIAFLLGLITLNLLNALQEQGEVSREEVLNNLRVQTREMSQGFSILPGFGPIASVPYHYLRQVPGMDVAVGVTAYQLASSVQAAITVASRSSQSVAHIAHRVGHAVSESLGQAEVLGGHSMEVARQATRGAMHAIDDVSVSVGHLVRGSVIGVVNALGNAEFDTSDAFVGAGYGAIQGADEVGADIGEATAQAMEGAKEAARELGLSEDESLMLAAQGALQASLSLSPEAAAEVKDALLSEMMEASPSEADQIDDIDNKEE